MKLPYSLFPFVTLMDCFVLEIMFLVMLLNGSEEFAGLDSGLFAYGLILCVD